MSKAREMPSGCGALLCFVLDKCTLCAYTIQVIKSYRHKGLQQFAEKGSKAGIQPQHADNLRRLLTALDAATRPEDLNAASYQLHPLQGNLAGQWAVSVNGNWRLTFCFEGEDVVLLDYRDYH
jgi:proteic killer suppression protein